MRRRRRRWKTRSDSTRRRSESFVHFGRTNYTVLSESKETRGAFLRPRRRSGEPSLLGSTPILIRRLGRARNCRGHFRITALRRRMGWGNWHELSVCACSSGNTATPHLPRNAVDLLEVLNPRGRLRERRQQNKSRGT